MPADGSKIYWEHIYLELYRLNSLCDQVITSWVDLIQDGTTNGQNRKGHTSVNLTEIQVKFDVTIAETH